MKSNLKMALVVTAAAVLAACGSSDDGPLTPRVASADTTVAANTATTAGAYKVPLTFPAGVPELNTTSSTTVTFGTPTAPSTEPTFNIAGFGQGTASGTTAFGSCIFKVLSSSFPVDHPLAAGKLVKVDPCEFKINTKGLTADGTAVKRKLTVKFGQTQSDGQDVDVKVDRDGNVKVNDQDEGKTEVVDVTGGSS